MEYMTLGCSELNVSKVGLGAMRMGNRNASENLETVNFALDQGINFFDSADVYGKGQSSINLGQALKASGISRNQVIIQSKGGIVRTPSGNRVDFSTRQIINSVEEELRRLQVEYLDVFLLHRPDALVEPFEVAEAFNILVEQGKVRYFGVSNQNSGQIDLLKTAISQPLVTNQLQFGLMHSGIVDEGMRVNMTGDMAASHDGGILNYSRIHKMTIQTWSPLQIGYFGGVFIDNPEYVTLNKKLEEIADRHNTNKSAVAIAWTLRHPSQMQVISGSMSNTHIQEMSEGSEIKLSRQEWYDLYQSAGNQVL
ncbi:aldo/keto reductase [Weissella diestrammenae]|uniref:Aldo/keto reductase n=1 Tax=Weissella diestrammenae TaxID=1162633 RepID=A0A7G9T523_9LACO|nr:aldo/keto reductase [Weissella diestrammenae]MCM0582921.1 aldo/keto reductase [Weissella diestrammenae]QNN75198.1 aldo/keto reductase [Weissella diestrammenae]